MTREEAIELFKDVEVLVFRDVKQKYFHEDIEDAFKLAIKALKQEPILDKIRAEIEQKARPNELGGRGNGKSIRYGLYMALEIIDKYKIESEEMKD